MTPLSRRALLAGAGAALAASPGPARADALSTSAGLHDHALRSGRFYGAAIDQTILATNPTYMAHVPVECGVVVSEAAFKWGRLRPAPELFYFAPADALMRYAEQHALALRGHTLVWHEDNPPWLAERLTSAAAAERLLTTHIRTVVRHFRGHVFQWDVVNEVLWLPDRQPLGLRDTLWLRALGPRYIDLAFHLCAETDPGAMRFINEFGLDYSWPDQQRKRAAMLSLLADLRHRGVPVQGLGMQAHLEAGVHALDQKELAQFCADVAALGLNIVITEMDVRDNRLPAAIPVRDAGVAAEGRAFLEVVLESPALLGVVTWGLSDLRTWLDEAWPRTDGLPQRPLPLDREMRRKPLWEAMAATFDAALPLQK
ncbi:MAG TPA: endo-1,4-beta-xylanase [Acetobacteraceae bacterium]|nr:endo-1,4-beta-xylanase [Acetobacteraceae bacterium]